jgi:Zn-finger nucleic acid-binding protein
MSAFSLRLSGRAALRRCGRLRVTSRGRGLHDLTASHKHPSGATEMAKVTDRCPECGTILGALPLSRGQALACRNCAGVCVNLAVLREHAPDAIVQGLWASARDAGRNSTRRCPSCENPLRTFEVPGASAALELDACARCQLLWFDGRELEQAGVTLPAEGQAENEARQARALMDSQAVHEDGKFKSSAEFARFMMADVYRFYRHHW